MTATETASEQLIDRTAIATYLETLHPRMKWPGALAISPVKNGTFLKTQWPTSFHDAVQLSMQLAADGHDVYVGVATRAAPLAKGRGGKSDCAFLPALFADIDYGETHDKTGVCADQAAALQLLDSFDLAPTMVVDSGYGLHPYWCIDEPVRQAKANALIDAWKRRWASAAADFGVEIDDEAIELARVLRVPGTINFKHGTTRPVRVLKLTSKRYSVSDIERVVGDVGERPPATSGGRWNAIDLDALDPADRAALTHLETLGGHDPFIEGGTAYITRPGKMAGKSMSIGWNAPGVVYSFTSGWKFNVNGTAGAFGQNRYYDVDQLAALVDGDVGALDRDDCSWIEERNGADPAAATSTGRTPASGPGKASQATELVAIAEALYRFGRSPKGDPFAVPITGPKVVRMLRGGRDSLRAELAAEYHRAHQRAATQSALADAMLVIEGRAQQAEPVELHLRVAAHEGDVIVDLGDDTGRCIRVRPGAWTIDDEAPVMFRRTALTAPLPIPERGGTVELLRDVVNVTDAHFPLLLAWMVAAYLPDIPYPIALLEAEQGSGKTTNARHIVGLIDPSTVPVRTAPRDAEGWVVTADGSHAVAVDNISTIQAWFSDALCRASTGDGLVRRRLYTDGDLAVTEFRRVVMLTSIDPGALRGDLADRMVALTLERLDGTRRRSAREIEAAYAKARPSILGALLDLFADVIAVLPDVHVVDPPRMVDFANVVAAVDKVLGTDAVDVLRTMQNDLAVDVTESDPIAQAVQAVAESHHGGWAGTPAKLLVELTRTLGLAERPKGWPTNPRQLAGALKRLSPALRSVGVDVEVGKTNGSRWVRVGRGT